jgi:hypothetical protein
MKLNPSSDWFKRVRRTLGALSIALFCVVAGTGFAGCIVKENGDQENGGKPSRGDPEPTAQGGDPSTSAGGQAGATAESGAAGASDSGSGSGGTADGEGGESSGSGGSPTGGTGLGGTGSGVPGADAGTWTYLVYMLADNDLEPFALQDLEELMQVGSGEKLTILAQVDRAVGEADADVGGLADFTGTKRVRIESGSLVELEDLGETNMGQSATLAQFLAWGIETAPSEHYALVLWDHGSAWPQFGADFSHANDGLTLAELTTALDQGASTGKLLGPLDFVGFDACLMATWEVAVGLQGRARYLLASEEVEPGHGWDHRRIAALRKGAEPRALGEALLDGYRTQAVAAGTLARITLSLTDLSKLSLVTTALGELTSALTADGMAEHAATVGKSRAAAPTFGSIPGGSSSHMTDLAVFADGIAELESDLALPARAVRTALEQAVVARVEGSAHGSLGGLSIFFPERESGYLGAYAGLADVGAWRDFLEAFYDAAGSTGASPVFINSNKVAEVSDVSDGVLVEGQLEAGSFDNLTDALFDFGIIGDDETAYFMGEQVAEVSASGLVSSTWDTSALMLSQGTDSVFGFYSIEIASDDVFTLSVPFVYDEGGESLVAVLLLAFDSAGTVLSQGFYSEIDGAWAELVTAPGSTLTSLVPALEPNASELDWIPQVVAFDATQAIDLEFLPLDPGTQVFVQLQVSDFAGQGDSVSAVGTL